MAPPGVLSFYESLDNKNNNSPSSSLLLSPFPSFSSCISHISVYSDHSYFFKNMDDNMKKPSPELITIDDCCFDFDMDASEKNSEVMTPSEEESDSSVSPAACHLSTRNSSVNDNVFNDVTLVNQNNAENISSSDTDFLQGLDDMEFDFDDTDQDREVSLENFIDATLDDVSVNDFNNNENRIDGADGHDNEEEEEDIYKKEFFMKHLRLRRASSEIVSSHKNRKRKHEESESLTHTHSCSPLPVLQPEVVSHLRNNHRHYPHITTTQSSTHNSSPSQLSTPLTPLSVPSKSCSCASNDWQRTILYSTAKSPNVISVQTSPSTASVSGIPAHHPGNLQMSRIPQFVPSCHSDLPYIPDNNVEGEGRLSPSLLLSDGVKNCFEFDLLDKSSLDEDTEDLLQWLDNQETQTTIAEIASITHSQTSSSTVSSRSASERDSSRWSGMNTDGNLERRSHQLSLELDSFMDLESYVTDEPLPVKQEVLTKNVNTTEKLRTTNPILDNDVFSKSQLRLSILADISQDCLNSEYKQRKDAIKQDIIKSCCSNEMDYTTVKINQRVSDYWNNDSPFSLSSPLSSSSSSSSSPPSSPYSPSELLPSCQAFADNTPSSKSMDLLDLFSDENAAWCL